VKPSQNVPAIKGTVVMSEELVASADAQNDARHTDEGNLSREDMVAARLAQQTEPEEETVEEESEPDAETEEVTAEEEEESETDGLPVDLEKLSKEELDDLKSKLTPGAVKRIGKLTAKNKAAGAEIERLKTQLEQKPAFTEPALEQNPYGDILTAKELDDKYGETTKFIDDFRAILDDNEDALSDDEVFEEDGQSWTKKQVKTALRNAEKAKEKFLPARLNEVRHLEQLGQQTEQFRAQLEKELVWLNDEDSVHRKTFDSYMNSQGIKSVREKSPEFAPLIDTLIGWAIQGRDVKSGSLKAPAKPKLTATSAVKSSAAPSATTAESANQLKELTARFEESGSSHDASRLRAFRMNNRQKLTT